MKDPSLKKAFIPYVPGISEAITRKFREFEIVTINKPNRNLENLLSFKKDKLKPEEQANGIYGIPCQNCPALYIGETKRTFGERWTEHRKATEKGDESNAVAAHAKKYNHTPGFEAAKILIKCQNKSLRDNYKERKFKETITLHSKQNSFVNRIHGMQIPEIYIPAIHMFNSKSRAKQHPRQRDYANKQEKLKPA